MKKSSLLLLPTVLAVSTTTRVKPISRESVKPQSAKTVRGKPKNLSIDFVFSVGE